MQFKLNEIKINCSHKRVNCSKYRYSIHCGKIVQIVQTFTFNFQNIDIQFTVEKVFKLFKHSHLTFHCKELSTVLLRRRLFSSLSLLTGGHLGSILQ